MKKKILLSCLSDYDGTRFKKAAKEKLEVVGYEVVEENWAENIEEELPSCLGMIAFVNLDLVTDTVFFIDSLCALSEKYHVPLIGIKSNEETWSSELRWIKRGVTMLTYDDFVEKNISPVGLKKEIEQIFFVEERLVGYASTMIH